MLTVSLWLIAAALSLATVALTITITLDRSDQHRSIRSRKSAEELSTDERQPTVIEWTHSLVLSNNELRASQARPDIIIGPWTSSSVNIKNEPRKVA